MRVSFAVFTLLAAYYNHVSAYSKFAIAIAANPQQQVLHRLGDDRGFGSNEPFVPVPGHILPEKKPFHIDEEKNYYERFLNGSKDGFYRRTSCPAINALANRGYINRSGRGIGYSELAHAVRNIWNFGDDNIMLVLAPTFALHGWPETIDLDMFNDDSVQYAVNCPAAPTRNDRAVGDNVNINMTLYNSLMSFSSDGVTLSLEDMAKHHHLRHNQSLAENPTFVFGNQGALCSLAQYTNMVGVLGKYGKHGRTTLYVEDVEQFYLKEDIPRGYERREAPYYSMESNALIDRMSYHVGYTIQRPFPEGDQDPGRDICPVTARFQKTNCP